MNTPETKETTEQNPRLLLKKLQEQYASFRDHAPLAIGVDKTLLKLNPAINKKTLRIALGMHTNSLRYLKTMEKATHRMGLDGEAGDALTDEHRKHATETLRERHRKNAERIRLERAAEAEAAEAKQRADNLNKLVEKFGKTRAV